MQTTNGTIASRTSTARLLYANFNTSGDCLALGLDDGYRVYAVDHSDNKSQSSSDHKEQENGHEPGQVVGRVTRLRCVKFTSATGRGIAIVEMLGRSNVLALVGGGHAPRFAHNKVVLWDDGSGAHAQSRMTSTAAEPSDDAIAHHEQPCSTSTGRPLAELEFRAPVRAVRMCNDRVVVVLDRRTFVYALCLDPPQLSIRRIRALDTGESMRGVCALSTTSDRPILAVPGQRPGHVQLVDIGADNGVRPRNISGQRGYSTPPLIAAHTSPLAALAFSSDATMLATASVKGTLVRVFDTSSGRLVHELRRGSDGRHL